MAIGKGRQQELFVAADRIRALGNPFYRALDKQNAGRGGAAAGGGGGGAEGSGGRQGLPLEPDDDGRA